MNDLISEASQGSQAEAHLEFLAPVFDQLKQELLAQWYATQTTEGERRERLWMEVHVVDKALRHITQIIETGKLARTSLNKGRPRKYG